MLCKPSGNIDLNIVSSVRRIGPTLTLSVCLSDETLIDVEPFCSVEISVDIKGN